jgi:hypothetical protein
LTLLAAFAVISLAGWPDPFDPAFLSQLPKIPPGEEVEFRPAPARPWIDAIRSLPAESPGRQQYVEFLKEKYAYNIESLNKAYGLTVSSFTELFSLDFRRLDKSRPAVIADDTAFLKLCTRAVLNAAKRQR